MNEPEVIILNKNKVQDRDIKQVISALSNQSVLIDKGGFLFKAFQNNNEIHIGILPYFLNGERMHHYDIEIDDYKYTLTGFVSSVSTINMLIKLSRDEYKAGLSRENKLEYQNAYLCFSRFLISNNYPKYIELDLSTKMVLDELKLFDVIPSTVFELANAQ